MANPALAHFSPSEPSGLLEGRSQVTTLDTVVQRTAVTLSILVAFAVATWLYMGSGDTPAAETASFQRAASFSVVASLAALGLSFWISLSSRVRVGGILLFSALEGVLIGAFSKLAVLQVGSPEVIVGAVLGTFVASAVTLAVYKTLAVRVTAKFRRGVVLAMLAFVGVAVVDFLLSLFGAGVGVNGFGAVGVLASFVGVAIAVLMLVVDFDAVEQAVASRQPLEESWRLAFGLTVTLVWLYVNLLRILTYFSQD